MQAREPEQGAVSVFVGCPDMKVSEHWTTAAVSGSGFLMKTLSKQRQLTEAGGRVLVLQLRVS